MESERKDKIIRNERGRDGDITTRNNKNHFATLFARERRRREREIALHVNSRILKVGIGDKRGRRRRELN